MAEAPYFDETDFTLTSFAGTPKGIAPFRIRTGIDDVVADVSAGVEVLALGGTSLKLFYEGRFGDTIQENAAGAKATVPFEPASSKSALDFPNVRYGSRADSRARIKNVRLSPPRADMPSVGVNVCEVPQADKSQPQRMRVLERQVRR